VLCDDSVRWTVCLTTSENVAVFGNGGDLKLVHTFELLDSCCKHLSLHFFKLPVMQQSRFSQKVHSAPFYHTQIMTDNCWCPVTEVTTGAFNVLYTQGGVTSQYLRPRYDRSFEGITWHNLWS